MSAWERAGESSEWYTPKRIFDALGCTFDMDVAAPADRTHIHVPAREFLTSGGLETPWHGFVWMNPPYSEARNGVWPWLRKFVEHGNGIACTADRTSAPWFQDLFERAQQVLFLPKVRFHRPDGVEGKWPGNGTALWACGEEASIALDRAQIAGLGVLCIPQKAAWNGMVAT